MPREWRLLTLDCVCQNRTTVELKGLKGYNGRQNHQARMAPYGRRSGRNR